MHIYMHKYIYIASAGAEVRSRKIGAEIRTPLFLKTTKDTQVLISSCERAGLLL